MAATKAYDDKVVMTREGYDKLKAELIALRGDGRAEIAAKLEEARGFGDLSENAEYHAAKEEQEKLGEVRLFPTVKLDGKSGKGNAISKGTSNLLARLKITVEEGKTTRLGFHSFRNNVIQELQGADASKLLEERRRAYVGHAPYEKQDNTAHKLRYMRAWKPSEIEGLHGGITWGQWLDFDALKNLLAQTQSDADLNAQRRADERAKKRRPTASA